MVVHNVALYRLGGAQDMKTNLKVHYQIFFDGVQCGVVSLDFGTKMSPQLKNVSLKIFFFVIPKDRLVDKLVKNRVNRI